MINFIWIQNYFLTLSASFLPTLKFTTFFAAIFISSPVWGFLPTLAGFAFTSHFPQPIKLTSSPFTRASSTTDKKASNFLSASAFVANLPFSANSVTKSFLFILFPLEF